MTDATRQLVHDLQRASSGWRRPSARDPRVSILEAIGRDGDASAIVPLVGLLMERGDVGSAAAQAIDAILSRTSAVEIARLEPSLRSWSRWSGGDTRWFALDRPAIERAAPAPDLRLAYFGMASFHVNGYVREASVFSLDRETSGRELLFLVLRLNDWVPQVRQRAEAAVQSRLTSRHAEAWVPTLPLLLGLRERGRHHAHHLIEAVIELMTDPDLASAFELALTSTDRAVRRAAHSIAREVGGDALTRAAPQALADPDAMIRLGLAKVVRASPIENEAVEAALLADSSMGVRREVLLGRIERDAETLDEDLDHALLDAHASIRQLARYFVAKRAEGPLDFAARYRNALARARTAGDTRALRASLGGLAETGQPADAALALPDLGDSRASVREAALRALARLDAQSYVGQVLASAEDDSTRVARVATEAIEAGLDGVDAEVVLSKLLQTGPPAAQAVRLRALSRRPHWTALLHLLGALAHPPLQEQALDGLHRWVWRGAGQMFVAPSLRDIEAGLNALDAARDSLPSELAREIEAQIRRWS